MEGETRGAEVYSFLHHDHSLQCQDGARRLGEGEHVASAKGDYRRTQMLHPQTTIIVDKK